MRCILNHCFHPDKGTLTVARKRCKRNGVWELEYTHICCRCLGLYDSCWHEMLFVGHRKDYNGEDS